MESPSRREVLAGGVGVFGTGTVAGCLGDGTSYGAEWADVDRIVLAATTEHWRGVEPSPIAEARNPMLRLIFGRTYEIEFRSEDDAGHRLQILNASGDVVSESEELPTADETASITVEASARLDEYRCPYFSATMTGEIVIFED